MKTTLKVLKNQLDKLERQHTVVSKAFFDANYDDPASKKTSDLQKKKEAIKFAYQYTKKAILSLEEFIEI